MLFWAVSCFGLGFIGMEFATIFTNSLMPSLSDHDDLGAISGSGFAFGYLGGLLALIIMLLLLAENATTGKTLLGIDPLFGLDPEAREGTRAVGPFTAIWYAVFMIPFFLWVKEPKTEARPLNIGAALGSLVDLLKSLRYRKSLSAYLVSSLFYRDALNALYGFGGVYASGVLNWSIIQIGTFGILGAVTAMVASWMGGKADRNGFFYVNDAATGKLVNAFQTSATVMLVIGGFLGWRYRKDGTRFPAVVSVTRDPNYANTRLTVRNVSDFVLPEKVDLIFNGQHYHDMKSPILGPVDMRRFHEQAFAALKPSGRRPGGLGPHPRPAARLAASFPTRPRVSGAGT